MPCAAAVGGSRASGDRAGEAEVRPDRQGAAGPKEES